MMDSDPFPVLVTPRGDVPGTSTGGAGGAPVPPTTDAVTTQQTLFSVEHSMIGTRAPPPSGPLSTPQESNGGMSVSSAYQPPRFSFGDGSSTVPQIVPMAVTPSELERFRLRVVEQDKSIQEYDRETDRLRQLVIEYGQNNRDLQKRVVELQNVSDERLRQVSKLREDYEHANEYRQGWHTMIHWACGKFNHSPVELPSQTDTFIHALEEKREQDWTFEEEEIEEPTIGTAHDDISRVYHCFHHLAAVFQMHGMYPEAGQALAHQLSKCVEKSGCSDIQPSSVVYQYHQSVRKVELTRKKERCLYATVFITIFVLLLSMMLKNTLVSTVARTF